MSRPQSSWGGIFGAIGAISAADGAQRAAAELKNLRVTQERALRTVQAQAAWERQYREDEELQKEAIRKLREMVFELSEHLPIVRQTFEHLLPDTHCAAAFFYESHLQQHANALRAKRELLESYDDKKLLTTCLDVIRYIRETLERYAATDRINLDALAATLASRRCQVTEWKRLTFDTLRAVNELSHSIKVWSGVGPKDFLSAVERLSLETASTRNALNSLEAAQRRFRETLDFVRDHPNISYIWPEASGATPSSVEDVLRACRRALTQAEQLTAKWTREVDAFKALKESFSGSRYEDLLERQQKCAPAVIQLPAVRDWIDSAVWRLKRASELIHSARNEASRRHWHLVLDYLRQARAVPCSQRLRPELEDLTLTALAARLPVRLAWILGGGTLLSCLTFSLRPPQWFGLLLTIDGIATVLVLILSCQIIAASWRRNRATARSSAL